MRTKLSRRRAGRREQRPEAAIIDLVVAEVQRDQARPEVAGAERREPAHVARRRRQVERAQRRQVTGSFTS
jgi:hypothetical protein